jgi:hypothetical protein
VLAKQPHCELQTAYETREKYFRQQTTNEVHSKQIIRKITIGKIVRVKIFITHKFFIRIIIVHFNSSQFNDIQLITNTRIHEYVSTKTEHIYKTDKNKRESI